MFFPGLNSYFSYCPKASPSSRRFCQSSSSTFCLGKAYFQKLLILKSNSLIQSDNSASHFGEIIRLQPLSSSTLR
ncbi:hypothetical protein Syn6312_3521 [Synechococcus sp. PCC 6312]|nr:hypothetical protein Syn6312_3521 [Synechococcus sp. PCC 6312]